MAGTAQAFLLVIVICVASASAGPSVRSQDALSTPLSAQVIKLGMSVENNLDAGESRPGGEDLGQYLGSGLALANGQLYRMMMQETTGLVEGVIKTNDAGISCGPRCASCNAATGQCTQCLDGAVLIMDAASPNQLICRSCAELNCAEGACTDGFGCSACPAGFGISSSEPPLACTVRCPPHCTDCDNVGSADSRSDGGRCNACSQGYMLTENGFCEEEGISASARGATLQQQRSLLPDPLNFLARLVPGMAHIDPTADAASQADQERSIYLTAAALRQDLQAALPLQLAQAVSSEQPALVNFNDFDTASLQRAASSQQEPAQSVFWLQWPAVPPVKGCLQHFLRSLLQAFMPSGLMGSPGETSDEPATDGESVRDQMIRMRWWEQMPKWETEEEVWIKEHGNAPSRMDPEQQQQLTAAQDTTKNAQAAEQTSSQEEDPREATLMNTLLGLAEPQGGESLSVEHESALQPAEQGVVKLSEAQPLGKAWTGLTASMLKPALDASQVSERTQQDMHGAAAVKLTDPQPLGDAWSSLTAAMLRASPDRDTMTNQAAAATPAQEGASEAVLTSVSEEPRTAVVSRDAVAAAARELAANTGISKDAALDRAVSAVLQAGSYAAPDLDPLWSNRRYGPADTESAWDTDVLRAGGDGVSAATMAVPPQSGPPLEVQRRGVISRVLDDISGAVRSAVAALSRHFAGQLSTADSEHLVPGVSVIDLAEEELDTASREAAAGAAGNFPAAALGRLQVAAEAVVRAHADAPDDAITAQPDRADSPRPLAYASGRGAASAAVPNVLIKDEATSSEAIIVPGMAAAAEVAAGTDPSLMSDMAVPVQQLPQKAEAAGVSANSINNKIDEKDVQGDRGLAEYAYADPSLMS